MGEQKTGELVGTPPDPNYNSPKRVNRVESRVREEHAGGVGKPDGKVYRMKGTIPVNE